VSVVVRGAGLWSGAGWSAGGQARGHVPPRGRVWLIGAVSRGLLHVRKGMGVRVGGLRQVPIHMKLGWVLPA
jgi:hypothetical protein